MSQLLKKVVEVVSEVLIEKEFEVRLILAAILARGHVLIEGIPGVAKTLTAKVISRVMGLNFRRIQMTPDLLPSDIIGGYIYDQRSGSFVLRKGPIFTNILLVDEINRASPRTQSALLEAMQERQVTIEGDTYRLEEPFIVLATQNPVESEGVFPLPGSQLDRFLVKIESSYPSTKGLIEIVKRIEIIEEAYNNLKPVLSREEVLGAISAASRVDVDDSIYEYIARIIEATKKHRTLLIGVSPRAGIALARLAKAWAYLDGRSYVIPDDVKAVAIPVLRHRLVFKPEYEIEGVDPVLIIKEILANVEVPRP
ncbi:MAG: AAA family ATPase [Desulfurococcales archaeon]|jgi:MoxR-like ATPase